MPNLDQDDLGSPGDFLRALRDPSSDLRNSFRDQPIELAKRFHLKFPPKPAYVMKDLGLFDEEKHGPLRPGLRELVRDVCMGTERSAVAVGPRGGGKSMGVSFIEFFLVFVKDYDALNLGGSELQADQVYQYLLSYIDADPYWEEMIKGESLQSKTVTRYDAWIRVLTASQKSVRSPHAGGRKKDGRMAGGLLVIDEEAETDPDIVSAALPTINTARPSVNVRCSTFHNITGSFADLVDNHNQMGYKLYHWDIFDVCEGCDCRGPECESEEKCFREDHYEDYVDPSTGQVTQKLVHRAYCGGRARYADGWIPMEEIETMWKRMKRNHGKWEVEAMGSRPTTSGHVIKDFVAWSENTTTESPGSLYLPGAPVSICVDWGTVAAGLTVWQHQFGDQHVLLEAIELHEAGQTQIFGSILSMYERYRESFDEIAADIGGGGNYLNDELRDTHRLPVRDVNFAEVKEGAVAAWNLFNEAGHCQYPAEFEEFTNQAKNWKRKNGRIQKGNDHMMDSSVCYFSKFIDRLGMNKIRVTPRSFSSATPMGEERDTRTPGASHRRPRTNGRVPIARGIGGNGRSRRRR